VPLGLEVACSLAHTPPGFVVRAHAIIFIPAVWARSRSALQGLSQRADSPLEDTDSHGHHRGFLWVRVIQACLVARDVTQFLLSVQNIPRGTD
jgi:hypothetical protein